VATWGASPQSAAEQNATPLQLNNQTVRMVARISKGGDQVRVQLSNTFGTSPLVIGEAHIASYLSGRPGGSEYRSDAAVWRPGIHYDSSRRSGRERPGFASGARFGATRGEHLVTQFNQRQDRPYPRLSDYFYLRRGRGKPDSCRRTSVCSTAILISQSLTRGSAAIVCWRMWSDPVSSRGLKDSPQKTHKDKKTQMEKRILWFLSFCVFCGDLFTDLDNLATHHS
jgi:hypothetical protein